MTWFAGSSRALFRTVVLFLLCLMLAVPWPAASQLASPVSGEGSDVVTAARNAAVPLGESARVGSLEIRVTGFVADASSLDEGPERTALPGDNERLINVSLELTNTGDAEFEFGTEMDLNLRFAGNRGILGLISTFDYCVVDDDIHSRETPSLAAGDSLEVNVCTDVLVDDIPSLQMLASMEPAFDSGISSSDEVEAGTWFELGADRPYDAGVAAEQVRVAMLVAPDGPAMLSAPDVGVTRNDTLVVELLDYQPDVTNEITGNESWHYQRPSPDRQYALASMRVTNVGDRPAYFQPVMVGGDGVGPGSAINSRVYEHETGMLLPGGSALWTGQWAMPVGDEARALVIAASDLPEAGRSWLLTDPAEPFTWEGPEVTVAPPAEGDDLGQAVPAGEEAAVSEFNLSVTRNPEFDDDRYLGYSMTITYAGDAESDVVDWWIVSTTPELYPCLTRGAGSLFLPGASTTLEIRCSVGFDATTPLRVEVGTEGVVFGEGPAGLFAREAEG